MFLCTGPSCCTPEVGLAAWEVLKQKIKDAGLTSGPNACYRTKVGCLRICCHGPTMVVYPEGTWYHGMTAERIPLFVKQHLQEGQPIQEVGEAPQRMQQDGQVAQKANRNVKHAAKFKKKKKKK